MEALHGMLISSRCSNYTEGSFMSAGTEIKGRKTGIRAIRVHQKHGPSLQQQCSAIDEETLQQLPRTYPSGGHAVSFGKQQIGNMMLWGQETKNRMEAKTHTVRIQHSILMKHVRSGTRGQQHRLPPLA